MAPTPRGRNPRVIVLDYLCQAGPSLSLASIADEVTERTHGTPAEDYPNERLEIYMELYYDHVPALAELGYLVYEQETDTVTLDADVNVCGFFERPIDANEFKAL